MDKILVRTDNLNIKFAARKESLFSRKKYINAVKNVSISIYEGETFGLVGESGCGKSTLANATLGFVKPVSGRIIFDGKELNTKDRKLFRIQRSRMQKIFQDPGSSLNPRFTVYDAVCEPLKIRKGYTEKQERAMVFEMLERVGLSKRDGLRYTMEFSGGQQQRIAIARALILRPDYLVCDEPVSALDVSVHAQILNLLLDLQQELNITYLFISHNLAVVKKLCKRMAIMYLGEIVEMGDSEMIFRKPLHPYTRALMSAILPMGEDIDKKSLLKGEAGGAVPVTGRDEAIGCSFAPRCPLASERCREIRCTLTEVEEGHYSSCPFSLDHI